MFIPKKIKHMCFESSRNLQPTSGIHFIVPVTMNRGILCNVMLCLVLFIVIMLLFYNRHLHRIRTVNIRDMYDHVMDLRKPSAVYLVQNKSAEGTQIEPNVLDRFNLTKINDKEQGKRPVGYIHHPVFKYITNNETMCLNTTIDYLIYIHSAPQNHVRRQAIRSTWAQSNTFNNRQLRLVFFIGTLNTSLTADYKHKQNISKESFLYGDIVQLDFVDHYRNLTYKAISVLKWITTYCEDVRFVIKADDDVFVNVFLMTQILEDRSMAGYNRIILGEYCILHYIIFTLCML